MRRLRLRESRGLGQIKQPREKSIQGLVSRGIRAQPTDWAPLKTIKTISHMSHIERFSGCRWVFREKFVQNAQKKFENLCKIPLDNMGKRRILTIMAPVQRTKALNLCILHKKMLIFPHFLCILTKKSAFYIKMRAFPPSFFTILVFQCVSSRFCRYHLLYRK